MNISECSYCGKLSLNENNVCSDCSAAIGGTSENKQSERRNSAEFSNQSSAQNSSGGNYRQKAERQYIPVNCWKCNALNNFAVTKICKVCKCHLKTFKTADEVSFGDNKDGLFSFLRIALIVVFGAIAISAVYKIYTYPVNKNNPPELSSVKDAHLGIPPNSWYQPSIWNLYRKFPTVEEILEKNNTATSKIYKPHQIESFTMKGLISLAELGCATSECEKKKAEIAQKIREENEKRGIPAYLTMPTWQDYMKERKENSIDDDDFNKPKYKTAGRIEIYSKKPAKSVQKVFINARADDGVQKAEIIQGFNGLTGWKKETAFDIDRIIESKIEDLKGEELEKLNKSVSSMMKTDYNPEMLTFVGLALVNEKVHFLIEKYESDGPENLYFDAVTGFLTKIESKKMLIFLFPYQEYNEINFPNTIYFRIINKEGIRVWMKIENIDWLFNAPIEDSIFEKPIS